MNRFTMLPKIPSRIALLTAVVLLLPVLHLHRLAAAERPQGRSVSLRERELNANQQTREYRRQQAAKGGQRGILSASGRVGIHLNSAAQSSSTIFFYDDMESGANGWTTETYSDTGLWHQTTLNALSPSHSWWPGVELQGNYDAGSRVNGALISPSIDLTGATAPVSLLFAESYETERGWDYCMVDVSTDGGTNWNHLRGGYGAAPTGSSDGWIITTLDLSAYVGNAVKIRFYFDTGDEYFNDFPGWFVDDVVIFDQGGRVTGKKFFDVNNNGVKDIGERGVKNWLITATGPITLTTRTNYRGRYWLTLPLGSYTVSETYQPNWTQTYPLTGTWSLNLSTPDTLIDSVHFGNYINASFINGKKFHDFNHDGVYNNSDTVLPEWKILLCDTSGNQIDFDRTDSLGEYSLYVFEPGTYLVKEVEKNGWVQTAPAGESYLITVPNLNTDTSGNDFANYYAPLTNSILGMRFDDRNRSHSFDIGEQGLEGFKIQLYRKGNGVNYNLYKTRTTDSSGLYQFSSLPADTYRVKEVPQQGWWQSYPDSFYSLILTSGATLDNVDFGDYAIAPGSVAGLKYGDENDNGSRDSNETGLSGWDISLTGTTYFHSSVNRTVTTDGSGNYTFGGVWPGSYVVSEVWRTGWRQTDPPNFGPHFLSLGAEESANGLEFGNVADSAFSGLFRTFTSDELAYSVDLKNKHKPIRRLPDKVEFWTTFVNNGLVPAGKLTMKLSVPLIDSLTSTKGAIIFYSTNKNRAELTFDTPLDVGDSVTVSGFGKKAKPEIVVKWWWTSTELKKGIVYSSTPTTWILRWPMPNALNLLEDVGAGLKVGLGGPHSVVHRNWKDIVKSLFIKPDRTHIGDPRCLDKYAGSTRSIKRELRYLTPSKGNNKLFAELVALQANIRGSDLLELPGGFGNLVFDDTTSGGSPLNGLTIRQIAAEADSFMSSYKDTVPPVPCAIPNGIGGVVPESLCVKIHMINAAFSGPIDSAGFSTGLRFSPVAPLSSVPVLRYDPTAAQRAGFAALPPQRGYVPDAFALYQNYPNPFNPTTTISFTLSQPSLVTVRIYNILGQVVATLVDRQEMDDGDQEVNFDASNLPSGVYFYHLRADGIPDAEEGIGSQTFTAVKKMLLLK